MAQWTESSFQLGWKELFDDPSKLMIPSTQQAMELLVADHDHQYEFAASKLQVNCKTQTHFCVTPTQNSVGLN